MQSRNDPSHLGSSVSDRDGDFFSSERWVMMGRKIHGSCAKVFLNSLRDKLIPPET